MSYNSYLIDDESVTLIDTVEVDFFETYLRNIRAVIGDRHIDHLVINHMEPDHSPIMILSLGQEIETYDKKMKREIGYGLYVFIILII